MSAIFNTAELGEQIRSARKTLGQTQQWLADHSRCRRATIVAIERGSNVSVRTLLDVLSALGLRLVIVDARPRLGEEYEAMLAKFEEEN